MGRPPSIDQDRAQLLLSAYQRTGSKAAAAREAGVSESAARRFFDDTPEAAAPSIALQRDMIETVGASLFETRAALEENYARTVRLITQLEAGVTYLNGEYSTLTPLSVLVSALREAREHVQSGMKFYQLLISVDETKAFREAVLEEIRAADEPTYQRIIARLQTRRSLELAF